VLPISPKAPSNHRHSLCPFTLALSSRCGVENGVSATRFARTRRKNGAGRSQSSRPRTAESLIACCADRASTIDRSIKTTGVARFRDFHSRSASERRSIRTAHWVTDFFFLRLFPPPAVSLFAHAAEQVAGRMGPYCSCGILSLSFSLSLDFRRYRRDISPREIDARRYRLESGCARTHFTMHDPESRLLHPRPLGRPFASLYLLSCSALLLRRQSAAGDPLSGFRHRPRRCRFFYSTPGRLSSPFAPGFSPRLELYHATIREGNASHIIGKVGTNVVRKGRRLVLLVDSLLSRTLALPSMTDI